ncbi:hypothetical protein QTA57_15665 [Fontisubflavum oceani]|uniref:pseudaminic acid biosynthesis-associated methylase n=1 Tax=Paracoccaceae TaxID=31989 RepID=UPI001D0A4A4F|nr:MULTISPECIES: pseudaminic acid biosynthesis-associated methylase [Paracoccaceae]WJY21195.1 hypothetical protein QTA57_15665 [Fontisubflavum oceani]
MKFKTEQESFWAGEFGTDYIDRNIGEALLAANLNFFTRALVRAGRVESVIEFGANVGMNLRALKLLYPNAHQAAIEINADAARRLSEALPDCTVTVGSILGSTDLGSHDLALIKGVLIHINPDALPEVYDALAAAGSRHVMIAEYYNPTPVSIPYRGHKDRLFKRDFAGEFLHRHPNFELIDYGFSYHRDPAFPQDDITWFLLGRHGADKEA